ncbi:MFS transporter [Methanoculleus sp. YWC-01]|uniref:MFS transporter n=1 Tax=Methanoculleus nereidis TaxID=2735141 RepID=A0ABU3Z690_9EURY|nr:MFS transporter [Methanoculleus sp. YWC-01]MCK9299579.1 MFS transporter [Methanoculleus sp.]MDV4344124.1 MFS transporter [Methanoculleus sp. YWC-01]
MPTSDIVERRTVLIIATLAAFLTPFMGSAVNIALPSIAAEFALDAVSLSFVASSYLLATAIFLVPLGRCADIYGRKRVFTLGVVVFTASALLSALATSGLVLILFRFLEGIGSAMIYGTGIAMITSVFPPEERGRALGINVTAVYVGLSIGPLLGGYLTEFLTWRSIFLTNIPLGIYIVFMIRRHLAGEWADACGERFDIVGSAFYGAMLLAVVYGFSRLPDPGGVAAIVIGVAFSVVFYAWETRVESPVLNIGLLAANRAFAFSNLAALINYGATFAVGFLLSLYLQVVRGLDPGAAGLVLITQPVIQALFATPAGRLSDRVEPRYVASAGMGLTAVGLALLTLLTAATPMTWIVASLVLLGFGFALFSSPNTNAVMSSVDRSLYGLASGMLATMRTTGMMFSLAIATVTFALFIGSTQIGPEVQEPFMTSLRVAFSIFAVLCTAGIFASLARGRVRK